jgi:protein-L-isoaspartate(D-aspartate) O-methyltransferase
MMQVPREEFIPETDRAWAYDDTSLPIGYSQTISQPSLVGRMIDLARTAPEHTVLDIGTGSGYQAAILSLLVKKVVGVERVPELAEEASARLAKLGYTNVEVHEAGDELGWREGGPYDSIIVGAASPEVPQALTDQLKVGSRLVIPVGSMYQQHVLVVVKTPSGVETERREPVRFVPLVGKGAWE